MTHKTKVPLQSFFLSFLVVSFSCTNEQEAEGNREVPILKGEPIIIPEIENHTAVEQVDELNQTVQLLPKNKVVDQNNTIVEEGLVVNGKIISSDANESFLKPVGNLPPLEDGSLYKPMAFTDLLNFKYKVNWEEDGMDFDFSAYSQRVPRRLREWSGSKVALEGFMIPTVVDENNEVKEFLLLPDQMSCCFGQPPEANGWVVVTAEEGVEVLMDRIIRVTGVITVEERWDEEFFVGLYHMDCKQVTGPAL